MNKQQTAESQQFDDEILMLIPHRPPMLLINELVHVDANTAKAIVHIDSQTSFYQPGKGVPSWVGLEYMGQTAALIAGKQMQAGELQPHLGILLGSRKFSAEQAFFKQRSLLVESTETASVGDSLITFHCTIRDSHSNQLLAEANLSVLRNPT